MNQKCYPTTGQLADGRPAPAKLQVVDSDQGIISFAFLPDPLGIYQTTVPGMMTLGETTESSDGRPKEAGPTADIDDISRPISFNAISVRHEAPQLSSPYKVAVLLTAVPANLNSNRNIYLYRVTKSPSDVAKFLPASARAGLEAANGPELEVKVNPSIETARVGWTDSAAGDIEASFGLRGDVTPNIDPLVINKSADNQGGASLDAISTALAAQVYASFTDRYQGARGAPLQAGAEPAGYVENVSHRVSPQGAAVTGIQWPQKLAQIDVFSLLPDSTRRIVLRLAPSPMKVNA